MADDMEAPSSSGRLYDGDGDLSDCHYAVLQTPPHSAPRSSPSLSPPPTSNWTVLSSLHHSAILGEQAAKTPLLIRVRRAHVLTAAVVLVLVLLTLVAVFARGVSVGTLNAAATVDVLSTYNFYTGTMAAMLAKPFELALALFVPVLSLVVSPRDSLHNDSLGWRALQAGAEATLAALLTGSFSTLNVQQLDPLVAPVILASDLSVGFATTATLDVTASGLDFSLRETADTILRTVMKPVYVKTTASACQGSGGWPNIATTYAFFANDWLVDLLPTGREAAFSLSTSVGAALASPTTTSTSALKSDTASWNSSGFNASLAGNLLLHSMFFSQTLLGWDGLSYLENSSLARFQEQVASWPSQAPLQSTTSDEDAQVKVFRRAASAMLNETLSQQSVRLGLLFDVSSVKFNVSHVALLANIVFDAVTIEIPFDELAIASNGSKSGDVSNSGSGSSSALAHDAVVHELISSIDCGETTCLIPSSSSYLTASSPSVSPTLGDTGFTQWDAEPQIQAFAACLFDDGTEDVTLAYLHGSGCTTRSTSSFLVFSFARRAVADQVVLQAANTSTSSNSRVVTVTNLQRYHTITVGRLSWRTTDLASDFSAFCGVEGHGGNCTGLSFPLETARDSNAASGARRHLVVGEKYLPLDALGEFQGLYSRWTPLVMLTTPSDKQGDLLSLRNVRRRDVVEWATLDGQCSSSIDLFAKQVEQNRWYMDFGLQESYSAALFLLFQNAVVRQEVARAADDGDGDENSSRTLDFDGSTTAVTLQARIPLPSVLVSIGGSLVVLAGALCLSSTGRRKEGAIQRDLGVEEIAKVLLVDRCFPRLFLDCMLADPDDVSTARPLHSFHIEALQLRQHKQQLDGDSRSGADGTSSGSSSGVFVRYPPQF